MRSFLTGSRIYGQPTEESDVDMVVRVSPHEASLLAEFGSVCGNRDTSGRYDHCESIIMRYGPLNIIACVSDEEFNKWRRATSRAKRHRRTLGRGLAKHESVNIFRETFGER